MKRDEIETKLKDAVSNAAPDVLENILRKCDEKKGTVIDMEQNTNKNRGKNKVLRACAAIAAAAALLVVGVLIGHGTGQAPAAATSLTVWITFLLQKYSENLKHLILQCSVMSFVTFVLICKSFSAEIR